jgi:glycyl-tRNA synthetase
MSDTMGKLVSLCKRKGFVFQSSEIYGGLNGCWDYGPLGVELLRNIKEAWWREMTYRDDVEGIDASILMHPRTWEAAGVECSGLDFEGMATKMTELALKSPKGNELTDPRQFNMMFKTHVGPVEDSASVVYLRPETAQGIFVNFLNVQQAMRQKLPFGIAQIGKAFRNEITTKNFLFRTREFEQMEMQYFVKPGEEEKWFEYWKQQRRNWFATALGIPESRLRWHEHGAGELAHYARQAFDVLYEFPFGWDEVEGIHNRGQFDLSQHEEFSGKQLKFFDEAAREKVLPSVIETSIGASRSTMMVLANAYAEEEIKEGDTRTIMRFHPRIAPLKVAILPLVKRDGMPEIARRIEADLRLHLRVFYDEGGAIGRRYRRMDEVGTPFCCTVDSDTIADDTVTIRERDSMAQERVKVSDLLGEITGRMDVWKHPES